MSSSGERYGEPLASQLRTMIALHDDARYVLLPVELRFERDSAHGARGVLRVALVDARVDGCALGRGRQGDPSTEPRARLIASVAAKLADLIVTP